MKRVYNFSAGPSMLPLPVLEKAQKEFISYGDSGMSVTEMSHRSKVYEEIIARAESDLRSLMPVPENYKVLFLQGGASMQFAQIPLNLLSAYKTGKADYINSGNFANLAIQEAKRFGDIKVVASSKDDGYSHIPDWNDADFRPDADYVYICLNNTIYGTRFTTLPKTGKVPLVADASSCILSEPIDVSQFGILYAGAQKNVAPAGVTIVLIREDLLGRALDITPKMLDYQTMATSASMYNTPPCFPIYMAGLTFEWLLQTGGLKARKKINEEKAAILYGYLDESRLFKNPVLPRDRSIMNVTFVTGSAELDDAFCKEAEKAGFVNIKGHRSVGGMRASIYNAMPAEGIAELVEFMKAFELAHA
ncbi:MAG: 3-phosphoserine/phosphohydroxythreonine transaminase [Christensenellaceae bacterium]|jgi:phosphoserine aminotransferase|nr:3-phosphoserine/phosphohydroxythreonine transaminase [Christensenellaceae bacterium]